MGFLDTEQIPYREFPQNITTFKYEKTGIFSINMHLSPPANKLFLGYLNNFIYLLCNYSKIQDLVLNLFIPASLL